jgi:hypothetical protein
MGDKEHYKTSREEFEIDSDIPELQYCISHGKITVYCEDRMGDVTLACVPLRQLKCISKELMGIYETYVRDVRLMKYLKEEEE